MSYTALYRKFRPNTFEDVKGQDHIVTTLKNQIKANRIGHAYLFCGTRGTGKTTVAKILAKAVNCENPKDGSPCGECQMCKTIATGSSLNVVEIDAASNNGVDNIRDIIDQVSYSPTQGRYKVFIIDEVHMLSPGAFNALLKTLEEPPEYVIFILATTEVHKIPITVLSRCQQYDFHRITVDVLVARMQELMAIEQVQVTDKALRYIAKVADGSLRDALSLLDQCLAFNMDQELTYENTLEVLGAVDNEVFTEIFKKIVDQDVSGVITTLETIIMEGREISQFVNDFTWYLRNLMLIKKSDHMEDVVDMSTENINQLKEMAKDIKVVTVMRYIRIMSDLSSQLRTAPQKRVLTEIALIKMCKPQMEQNYDSILDRIRGLEKELEEVKKNGVAFSNEADPMGKAPEGTNGGLNNPGKATKTRPKLPKALPDDIKKVVKDWNKIKTEFGGQQISIRNAKLNLTEEGKLQLVFPTGIAMSVFNGHEEAGKLALEEKLVNRYGVVIPIDIIYNNTGEVYEDNFLDLEQLVHMDVEIIEEDE